MTDNIPPNPIDAQAMEWLARLDRGVLDTHEKHTLEAWLAQDVRHKGAFVRARAIWLSAGRVAAFQGLARPQAVPIPCVSPLISRRFFARAAAAVLVTGSLSAGLPAEAARFYHAKQGLLRLTEPGLDEIVLDQASVLTFCRGQLHISLDLLAGQVRLATSRMPLRLSMDDMSIDLRDGSFIARTDAQGSKALVLTGEVSIQCAGTSGRRVLHRHEWLCSTRHGVSTGAMSDDELQTALAWSRGVLEFQSVDVAEAVQEINRYNSRKISLRGTGLGQKKISGIFALNDPDSFARILCEIFNTKISTSSKIIEIF